jgi:hypothetical protein
MTAYQKLGTATLCCGYWDLLRCCESVCCIIQPWTAAHTLLGCHGRWQVVSKAHRTVVQQAESAAAVQQCDALPGALVARIHPAPVQACNGVHGGITTSHRHTRGSTCTKGCSYASSTYCEFMSPGTSCGARPNATCCWCAYRQRVPKTG